MLMNRGCTLTFTSSPQQLDNEQTDPEGDVFQNPGRITRDIPSAAPLYRLVKTLVGGNPRRPAGFLFTHGGVCRLSAVFDERMSSEHQDKNSGANNRYLLGRALAIAEELTSAVVQRNNDVAYGDRTPPSGYGYPRRCRWMSGARAEPPCGYRLVNGVAVPDVDSRPGRCSGRERQQLLKICIPRDRLNWAKNACL